MKRDLALVREMLIHIEAAEGGVSPDEFQIEGYTQAQIVYHVDMIMDHGLIRRANVSEPVNQQTKSMQLLLTWAGHEYLDGVRDQQRHSMTSTPGEQEPPKRFPVGMSCQEVECEHIKRTLEKTGGNREETARILDIGERTLYRKINEYGLR